MPKQPASVGGPVALVTGSGAPRIGNCVARTLIEHGYRVVLHAYRSVEHAWATAQELGAENVGVVQGDLRDEKTVRGIAQEVLRMFGRIDALVNCAAIWRAKPLERVTAEDVREHFETNTLATFLCCQQVGLIMVGQPSGGAIVNFGDWAIERPYLNYSAYFPSKGAIPVLTRDFAVELASRNPRVRVNAILPGPAMLPDSLSPAERQAAIDHTLVRSEGSPDHLADAVLFLLRNDFITGVCLPVDGGRTISPGDGSSFPAGGSSPGIGSPTR